MRIQGSDVALAAHRTYRLAVRREERLQVQVGGPEAAPPRATPATPAAPARRGATPATPATPDGADRPREPDDPQLQLMVRLLERLTGRKITIPALDLDAGAAPEGEAAPPPTDTPATTPRFSFSLDVWERREESESLVFQGAGQVRTADGREIRFEVEVAMARAQVTESRLSVRAGAAAPGEATDPLVLSLDGAAPRLGARDVQFDLDADGDAEQIAFVQPGAAFLALDRNGNGAVDDGGELFGPTGGDGYAELAALDADGNQWIDEGDPQWARLRLWTKGADGADQVTTLEDAGVGALFVGRVDGSFELRDAARQTTGRVAQSGVYLREDGGAGLMQRIDLIA